MTEIVVAAEDLVGAYLAQDIINEKTGEIYCEAGDELTLAMLDELEKAGVGSCRCWRSIISMSVPTSATPWRWTRTPAGKRR